MRTIKLEGPALELAHVMEGVREAVNRDITAKEKEAADLREAGERKLHELELKMKALLMIDRGECCHIQTEYLKEHNIAFVRTECGSGRNSGLPEGLGNILQQLMGGGAAKKPSGGGVH